MTALLLPLCRGSQAGVGGSVGDENGGRWRLQEKEEICYGGDKKWCCRCFCHQSRRMSDWWCRKDVIGWLLSRKKFAEAADGGEEKNCNCCQ